MPKAAFSPFDFVPGRVVAERFLIEGTSRQGGLAAVFTAHDQERDAPCELNVFPAALFDGAAQAEEYRHELGRWTAVRSSRVASVRDVLVLGGALIEVSDRPAGRSLREWLQEHKRMSEREVVALGLELLDGVMAIHERGLVHGDIKPQTIFVHQREQGLHPMLVDGGVTAGLWHAKHLGDRTALIGTPFYAPVEQFGGEAPDVQSDVYNVATVLFELATGVLPWPGKSLLEIFQAKLDRSRPSIQLRAPGLEIDRRFEEVVTRGLLADRKQRFDDATAFHAALAGLSPDE
jgi:eukaryotic-like serine/threonine-protein kinase